MEGLLVPGFEINPDVSPLAAEAIGGAIYSMIYDQIKSGGAENMQEVAPLATYITLAPFIGAERGLHGRQRRRSRSLAGGASCRWRCRGRRPDGRVW